MLCFLEGISDFRLLCFLEGVKINILSVGVLAKRSVCLEGIKVTFLVVV